MCKTDLCGLKSNPTTYLPIYGWCITHCSEVSMLVYTVTYLYTSCTRIIYTQREKKEIAVTKGSCHRAKYKVSNACFCMLVLKPILKPS